VLPLKVKKHDVFEQPFNVNAVNQPTATELVNALAKATRLFRGSFRNNSD